MKKQILGAMCLAAVMSSCHIYKSYDRPESIDASGIYRDPASATDTLVAFKYGKLAMERSLSRCKIAGFN